MKHFTRIIALTAGLALCSGSSRAIDNNTVEVYYNGTTATVTVASNIADYITVESGTSSHVKITQSEDFAGVDATTDNTDGEITYSLSGTTTDGEFYLEGQYKCTIELNGVTITSKGENAPLTIKNGKRVAISAKKDKVSTLTDADTDTLSGCIHSKGHLKFKGKGTLNIVANSKHGIYSKEYCELKNLTLNITAAPKDGIHCKNYFLMKSGTVGITGAQDDGIQVELDGETSTGETTDHEDEDSGNFYQEDGTLTISNYDGKAVKADGTITYNGGTQNFDTSDTEQYAEVKSLTTKPSEDDSDSATYDVNGKRVDSRAKGIVIRNGKKIKQ